MICLCPLPEPAEGSAEDKLLVLRSHSVSRLDGRDLFDHLSDGYVNALPAVAFISEYLIKGMLRPLVRLLRGNDEEADWETGAPQNGEDNKGDLEAPLEDAAELAIDELLNTLVVDGG